RGGGRPPPCRSGSTARPARLVSRSSWRHLPHAVALAVVRGLPVPHQGVLRHPPAALPPLWVDGLPDVGGAVDPRAPPPHRAVPQFGHASLQTRMVAPGDSSGRE